MPRCLGNKDNGQPCERNVKASQVYCYGPDPTEAEVRKRHASRAGRSRGIRSPVNEAARCRAELWRVAAAVEFGGLEAKLGAVIGQLLNTVLWALSVEAQIREAGEIEERLWRLEGSRWAR